MRRAIAALFAVCLLSVASVAQTKPKQPTPEIAPHKAPPKYALSATAKFVPATGNDKASYVVTWKITPAAPAGARFEVVRGDSSHALNSDELDSNFVVAGFAEMPLKDGSYSASTTVFTAGQENDFEVVAHNASGREIAYSKKIVGDKASGNASTPVSAASQQKPPYILQPFADDPYVSVKPVLPGSGTTATLDVYSQCTAPTGPSLLKPGIQNSVLGPDSVPLELAAKLKAGAMLCAIETSTGPAGTVQVTTPVAIVATAVPATSSVQASAARTAVVVEQPTEGERTILVDAVPVADRETAKLDVFRTCSGTVGTSPVPLGGGQVAVGSGTAAVTVPLKDSLKSQDTLCVIETFTPARVPGLAASPAVTVAPAPAAAAPVGSMTADQLESADKSIRSEEQACLKSRSTACLAALSGDYFKFFKQADANKDVTAAAGQNWHNDYLRLQQWGMTTAAAPSSAQNNKHLLCRDFVSVTDPPDVSIFNEGCFALSLGDLTGNVSHVRVMAGLDVSAASSADPSARFLFDSSLDIPISGGHGAPVYARNWLWGYVRLASIAQPGAISNISNLSNYVSALTAASPNQIVQSFEANGGYEYRIHTFDNKWGRRPVLLSFIGGGGIITPLSTSQVSTASTTSYPPIYIVTPALQTYYNTLATSNPTTINTQNSANINAACPAGTNGGAAPTCYIVQYPTARDHFFRNYEGGFRLKRYYYNDVDESFIFPATFDVTGGQNEYVTGGELHRWVLHVGGSTPVHGVPGLYAYTAIDLVLTKNSVQGQQFALQTAGSAITPASANVAQIFVVQPDRDRYRFGLGYDLSTLITYLAGKYIPKSGQ